MSDENSVFELRVRTNQDQCTPNDVLEVVRQLGPIGLDPCSNPWSIVNALKTFSDWDGQNGLAERWDNSDGLVYVNPVYKNIRPWVDKSAFETELCSDLEVLMLVPADRSTQWCQQAGKTIDARCDWHRRIAFLGLHDCGAKQPSQVLYWGPRRFLFGHIFDKHGDVWVADRRRY